MTDEVYEVQATDEAEDCGACGTPLLVGEEYVYVDGLPVHLECSLEDTTAPEGEL